MRFYLSSTERFYLIFVHRIHWPLSRPLSSQEQSRLLHPACRQSPPTTSPFGPRIFRSMLQYKFPASRRKQRTYDLLTLIFYQPIAEQLTFVHRISGQGLHTPSHMPTKRVHLRLQLRRRNPLFPRRRRLQSPLRRTHCQPCSGVRTPKNACPRRIQHRPDLQASELLHHQVCRMQRGCRHQALDEIGKVQTSRRRRARETSKSRGPAVYRPPPRPRLWTLRRWLLSSRVVSRQSLRAQARRDEMALDQRSSCQYCTR